MYKIGKLMQKCGNVKNVEKVPKTKRTCTQYNKSRKVCCGVNTGTFNA